MDELRAITTFVRAAELGSFHRAAQAQGTTPQAISKSVRQLEQHMGVRLFHRTTRKSSLTEEGRASSNPSRRTSTAWWARSTGRATRRGTTRG